MPCDARKKNHLMIAMKFWLWLTVLLHLGILVNCRSGCLHRDYNNDGTVCVCNAKHCDTIPKVKPLSRGLFEVITTSKKGERFHKKIGRFGKFNRTATRNEFTVDLNIKYQIITGFGGAFTDSAVINIDMLSKKARDRLLRSYFSDEGIEYSFGRIPLGCSDFSTKPYTYDDVENDTDLQYFNLTENEYNFKIPMIKEAIAMASYSIKLFGSPWTPPLWMKSNKAYTGQSHLLPNMYQAYADYFLKFVDFYKEQGVDIWGVTTGNEPFQGLGSFAAPHLASIPSLGWFPDAQSKWISENLGPTLKGKYPDFQIICLDDQRFFLPWWTEELLANETTRKYVDGIGVHGYFDIYVPTSTLTETNDKFPDKYILGTEMSFGSEDVNKVLLGSWHRAVEFYKTMIYDLCSWVTGFVDWNLALDTQGGPTYIENYIDSPVIVNATADEFYKQPMFYAIGHFSKFITPNSVRIGVQNTTAADLCIVGFQRPDKGVVLAVLNNNDFDVQIKVNDQRRGTIFAKLGKESINTIIYW